MIQRRPWLILPVGALDQHGRHLPLGTHTYIVERLAADLGRRTETLVAPVLRYGVNGPAARAYRGTASLRRKTLHRAVNEMLSDWEDHGLEQILILTAHRYEPHVDALLMGLTATTVTNVVDLFAIDVSDLLQGDPHQEHAGELETSLLLYLDPERVRTGKIEDRPLKNRREYRKYVRGKQPTPPPGSGGVVGSPSRADAERGRLVYERYLETCRSILSDSSEED